MAAATVMAAPPAVATAHRATARPSLPAFCGLASSSAVARVSASPRGVPSLPKISSRSRVRCAAGDVSSEGTGFLIAGAVAVALIGTAFPILFSRKDLCPVCDGSGFVRSGKRLAGNAGRKDDARIVCPNCSGLGKINQVDKA